MGDGPGPHRPARTVSSVLHAVATWWDGVELWLTQLDFTLQVILVLGVLGPLCWGVRRAGRLAGRAHRRVASRGARAPPRRRGLSPVDRRYARLWVSGTLVALIVLVIVLNIR